MFAYHSSVHVGLIVASTSTSSVTIYLIHNSHPFLICPHHVTDSRHAYIYIGLNPSGDHYRGVGFSYYLKVHIPTLPLVLKMNCPWEEFQTFTLQVIYCPSPSLKRRNLWLEV